MHCIKYLIDSSVELIFFLVIRISLSSFYSMGFVLFCFFFLFFFLSCFVTVLEPESFDFLCLFIFNESRDSNVTK